MYIESYLLNKFIVRIKWRVIALHACDQSVPDYTSTGGEAMTISFSESSWPYRLRKSHTNLVRNDNQYLGCQEIVYTIQRVATNTSGIAKLHIVVHRHEIRCLLALGHGVAQLVVWLDLTSNRVSISH